MKTATQMNDYCDCDWDKVLAHDLRMRSSFKPEDPDPFQTHDGTTEHLRRLMMTARKSGDVRYPDLLIDWYHDERFKGWTMLQRTILFSLVYSTFFHRSLRFYDVVMSNEDQDWFIQGMIDSDSLFLSFGIHPPFFPKEDSIRWRDIIDGGKPWISKESIYKEIRDAFILRLKELTISQEGGWEPFSDINTEPQQDAS